MENIKETEINKNVMNKKEERKLNIDTVNQDKLEEVFFKAINKDLATEETISFEDYFTQSYLMYGASIVAGRAIPHLFDGNKPGQRRVLYTMKNDIKLTHNGAFKKAARVVGAAIGTYHPHGDNAMYESLVHLAQSWRKMIPLADGQGNWGSIDGSNAAAMRYCVTGDTLIKSKDGKLIEISSLSNTQKEEKINLDVFSVNNKVNKSDMFFNSGEHEIYELKSKDGYSIKGSENHPVLVMSKNNEGMPVIKWVELKDISKEDYLIIDRTSINDGTTGTKKEINDAIISGCIVSEGSVSENRVTFVNTDKEYYDDFIKAFTENYKGTIYEYSRILPSGKEIFEFDIQNKQHDFFKSELFKEMKNKKAEKKDIPKSILNSGSNIQKIFLSYLFEGDGSISYQNVDNTISITYVSKSNKLISDIQTMLLNFGVYSTRGMDRDCFRISLNNFYNSYKFYKNINFSNMKKVLSDRIFKEEIARRELDDISGALSGDYIPFLAEYIRNKYKSSFLERNNFDRYDRLLKNKEKLLKHISDNKDIEFINKTLENNYYFSKIESITKKESKDIVYSIRVDSECHSFVANGIINHNTEVRLTEASSMMFQDINMDTVDFTANYDGSETEPKVLPVPFPNILINGIPSGSIASGMSSSIQQHNPTEVMNAMIKVIENRRDEIETTAEDILACIPAPDFPTGGFVYQTEDFLNIIKTGRGSVRLRAKYHIEDLPRGKTAIVVTEIPWGTVKLGSGKKKGLIEEVVLLKQESDKDNKIPQSIMAVNDESDKRNGLRIVIELKAGFDAEVVWNYILKNTNMDKSMSYFAVVLDNVINSKGEEVVSPKDYGLLEILERYVDFRYDYFQRKHNFLINQYADRLHILEGLMRAIDMIDEIIQLIKNSDDLDDAKNQLMVLDFSLAQAESIVSMRIGKLSKLPKQAFIKEYEELNELSLYSKKITSDFKFCSDELLIETEKVKKKIAKERKTIIKPELSGMDLEDIIPKEDCVIYVTNKGYVKRVKAKEINKQNRGTQGKKGIELTDGDFVEKIFNTNTHSVIMFIMNTGKIYGTKAYNVPDSSRGSFIDNIFETEENERIVNVLEVEDFECCNIIMVTEKGTIKSSELMNYKGCLRKPGVKGIKLKDDDQVVSAKVVDVSLDEEIVIATREGKAIRFKVSEISVTGRTSAGVRGIRLKDDNRVIGSSVLAIGTIVATITEGGMVKLSEASEFKIQKRGGVGVNCMDLTKKSGLLNSIVSWEKDDDYDLITITKSGVLNRINTKEIRKTSRKTKGVKLIDLKKDDSIVSVLKTEREIIEEEN